MIRFLQTRRGAGLVLAAIALVVGAASNRALAVAAYVMYQDSFTRGSVGGEISVHGTAPDVANTPSTTWNAFSSTNYTNGTVLTNLSSAGWLPFSPVNGNVYKLSADLNTTPTTNDWTAIAFATSNSTGGLFGNNVGPWMLQRGDGTTTDSIFLGPDTANGSAVSPSGTTGWANYAIVLDTTPALWTASFFRNGVLLAAPQAYTTNPTIGYIGFGTTAGGLLDNFTLLTPEPASLGLIALALPLMMRRRRR